MLCPINTSTCRTSRQSLPASVAHLPFSVLHFINIAVDQFKWGGSAYSRYVANHSYVALLFNWYSRAAVLSDLELNHLVKYQAHARTLEPNTSNHSEQTCSTCSSVPFLSFIDFIINRRLPCICIEFSDTRTKNFIYFF